MWGQVNLVRYISYLCGIIPTRVGTRTTFKLIFLMCQDHPHACGDKTVCKAILALFAGSSPRVWGQVCFSPCPLGCLRIIPTRVGTRVFVNICVKNPKDHPHACGDKQTAGMCSCGLRGSSPRVWGQATRFAVCAIAFGIIPTRVGTRVYFKGCFNEQRDHPHACGDKKVRDTLFNSSLGSSPRVWGQVATLI